MAQRIAKDVGASVWSVQHEKEADKLTTVRPLQWLAIGVIDQVGRLQLLADTNLVMTI